jgi:hypothetical protein
MLGQALDTNVNLDRSPLAHRCCIVCYPVVRPGVMSLCGIKLKGVYLTEQHDKCIVCEDLKETHSCGV